MGVSETGIHLYKVKLTLVFIDKYLKISENIL